MGVLESGNCGCIDKLVRCTKEGKGNKALSGGEGETKIEFNEKFRSKEAEEEAGKGASLAELEVNELEKIKVDFGVTGAAVDREMVGTGTAVGVVEHTLRMISTSSTDTGKRMSKHA